MPTIQPREETVFFHDRLGHRIAAVLARPEQTTDQVAVLCHGFLSHKNSSSNQALTELLIGRGIATFRFDCFGHGDSDGPFAKLTTTIGVGQALAALHYLLTRGFTTDPDSWAPASVVSCRFSPPLTGQECTP